MSRRLEIIKEIVARNENQIRHYNKLASQSRQPMPKEDRDRCLELRKANVWLRKAEFCIVQALAGQKEYIDTNPIKQPILAVRCAKCGRVYFAAALGYGVAPDTGENIKNAVAEGDELFITEEVKLQMCHCDKPIFKQEEDEE